MDTCFSNDYGEAREKFLHAARNADALTSRFVLDERGPGNMELSTDVAWVGPRTAKSVLVTLSATHGVEGFFGSATQIEWLRRIKSVALPAGVAALHAHAINPYGFAWLRRTNEMNVDINRNWATSLSLCQGTSDTTNCLKTCVPPTGRTLPRRRRVPELRRGYSDKDPTGSLSTNRLCQAGNGIIRVDSSMAAEK